MPTKYSKEFYDWFSSSEQTENQEIHEVSSYITKQMFIIFTSITDWK